MKTLLLFVAALVVYLLFGVPELPLDSVKGFVKCLPVAALGVFVQVEQKCGSTYARLLAVGLFTSALGDYCMYWHHSPEWFLYGVIVFSVTHLLYSFSFGLRHLTIDPLAYVTMVIACVSYGYLLPGLKGVQTTVVAIYVVLISSMTLSAAARLRQAATLPRLSACAGAVLFAISDFILAVDKFRTPLPYPRVSNMATYFTAQLLIALSVMENRVDLRKKKE
ncbi:lysoplasmalogenase-like protein TMEM86A [Branchiostoma floridae]|uniref:lysoplasmalogenase n=1 Tax=Branchiostoma floridae TaxID=7739 RepID=A0A9J7L2V5_BRAFL|nr:lysoplasmalogenase-like protein TMEM86A [Branchiostoma floridae]